jgi:hypothetical protein
MELVEGGTAFFDAECDVGGRAATTVAANTSASGSMARMRVAVFMDFS